MRTEHHSSRAPGVSGAQFDQRVYDALTNLHAYALSLDVECHRLDERLRALGQAESSPVDAGALVLERANMAEEVRELREAIRAFQEEILRPDRVRGERGADHL